MDNEQYDILGAAPQSSRFEPQQASRFAPEPSRAANESEDQSGEAHVLTDCPRCGRKLLSMRSILCNWCGAPINDPEYLERAAQERAALDLQMKRQIDRELAETAQLGVLGRLQRKAKSGLGVRQVNILVPPGDEIT